MNCKICGKELTDKRRKICKECAEKEKKEKEEMKAQKKETSKNSSNEPIKGEKKFTLTKPVIIAFAIIVVVLCIMIAVLLLKDKSGSTIGNIRNYGYAALDGNYIYYLAPNEDSTKVGIFKIKKDGTGEKEQLFMEDLDVVSINAANGYIYFIGIGPEEYNDEDEIDNKIYRMKTNGKNLTVINDNEFNNDCYEIYYINDYIYYIGTDNNIYKMSTDGSERTLVSENATGYLGVTEKYIIYNAETSESDDYITYIMNLDGTNPRPLIDGERLYSVNIDGNYVYYTNIDKQICKTEIDSGKSDVILDTTAYNMNLYGDYIYYLNYKDIENEDYTVCLYRIKSDGSESEPENIKELDSYSSFINIIDDWVIYMDSNETEGFINLVKTDGSEEVQLYLLDYEEYYSSLSDTDSSETDDYTTSEENTTPVQ